MVALLSRTLAPPPALHVVHDLKRSVRRLSVLLEVSRTLSSESDLDHLLAKIMESATRVLEADRCTLFLVDYLNDQLWSHLAQGEGMTEIRIPRSAGMAGYVATTGETVNIPDCYADPRFNRDVDKRTGYRTRNMLCMAMRNPSGKIMGVLQLLNKYDGPFDAEDEELLEALGAQAAGALVNAQLLVAQEREIRKTNSLLDVMRTVSTELDLDSLLARIMEKTTEVMDADRSSLYMVDHKTNEIWFKVAQGAELHEVRIPIGLGIAGYVAATGETVNIADAYEDPRFSQEMDRRTGYRTRSILCMPMRNAEGLMVGVVQVLNKNLGIFTKEDEDLLAAVASQEVIALENAKLFDNVVSMKNYDESILRSMATGIITIDMDGLISKGNEAAERILGFEGSFPVGGSFDAMIRAEDNEDLWEPIQRALEAGEAHYVQRIPFRAPDGSTVTMNASAVPLRDHKNLQVGVVAVIEDISKEQQLMGTLSRVVSRQVAEQIMAAGTLPSLGGERKNVTVLMADIRDFTTMTEASEPEEIVAMLNDYFSRMIEVVFDHEGTVDKFIGDAIMAEFGVPVAHEDDQMRAVLAGIDMRRALREFNADRVAEGQPPIEIGVGICDGEAVSGAIGSEHRMEFTVIGDTVNTSARLEGLTKQFPGHKLVFNETVYEAVKDQIPCDFLIEEYVKGKTKPVRVYGVPEAWIQGEEASISPVGKAQPAASSVEPSAAAAFGVKRSKPLQQLAGAGIGL